MVRQGRFEEWRVTSAKGSADVISIRSMHEQYERRHPDPEDVAVDIRILRLRSLTSVKKRKRG
jgi:hypothetical protein